MDRVIKIQSLLSFEAFLEKKELLNKNGVSYKKKRYKDEVIYRVCLLVDKHGIIKNDLFFVDFKHGFLCREVESVNDYFDKIMLTSIVGLEGFCINQKTYLTQMINKNSTIKLKEEQ